MKTAYIFNSPVMDWLLRSVEAVMLHFGPKESWQVRSKFGGWDAENVTEKLSVIVLLGLLLFNLGSADRILSWEMWSQTHFLPFYQRAGHLESRIVLWSVWGSALHWSFAGVTRKRQRHAHNAFMCAYSCSTSSFLPCSLLLRVLRWSVRSTKKANHKRSVISRRGLPFSFKNVLIFDPRE